MPPRSFPFVRGERPVIFRADRRTEDPRAVAFPINEGKPIILGGIDALKAATLPKEQRSVILTGVLDLPLRDTILRHAFENARN